MTIRQRLLVNTIGMIVLFTLVVIVAIELGWKRNLRVVAESLTGEKLERTEADLASFADPIRAQLLEAASWGADGLLDPDDPDHMEDLLRALIEEYPWMTAVLVADSRGRQFVVRQSGDQWIRGQAYPGRWGGDVQWAEWADDVPEKIMYQRSLDHDLRQEAWFLGAIAAYNVAVASGVDEDDVDLVYWTEPHLLEQAARPGMIAAVSFEREAGVDYVVAFELLLLEGVHRFTSGIGAQDDTRAFVMTDELRVMGLPRTAEVITEESVERALLQEPSQIGIPLVEDATNALLAHVDADRAFQFRSGGDPWWGEVETFTLPGSEHRLMMMVMVPEDGLTAHLRRQLWVALLFIVVASALVIWWAIRTARLISEPVEVLATESERLSHGRLDANPQLESSMSEVQRLGAALAQMRDSLSTLFNVESKLRIERDDQVTELPTVEGFQIAGWGEAAKPGDRALGYQAVQHQIASVWDHFQLDGGRRAIVVIADATGEGLESVFMASQARAMFRMAARLNPDLPIVAATIDEQLHEDLPEGHYVTAWLGELEAGQTTLTSLSAGVQTLFHYHATDHQCETVQSDSMPLGVLATAAAGPDCTSIVLEPGDVLAVASDGALALGATPGAAEGGVDVIVELMRDQHGESAATILEAVWSAIDRARGGAPLHVDCSVIVIKRDG